MVTQENSKDTGNTPKSSGVEPWLPLRSGSQEFWSPIVKGGISEVLWNFGRSLWDLSEKH